MQTDAMCIPAKITSAQGGKLFNMRMQNAMLIREYVTYLYAQVDNL